MVIRDPPVIYNYNPTGFWKFRKILEIVVLIDSDRRIMLDREKEDGKHLLSTDRIFVRIND